MRRAVARWRPYRRAVAWRMRSSPLVRRREGPGAKRQPLRTLGVLGDLHAERARLEVALDALAARNVDAVACVGDLADGDGDLPACLELLAAHDVITVAGNHDRWLLAERSRDLPFSHSLASLPDDAVAFLRALPPMIELATVAGAVVLCHGVGSDDMAVIDPRTTDHVARWNAALGELLAHDHLAWMIGGHTHQFMLRRIDHLGLINAGTLSRREDERAAREPERAPGFLRVDFERRIVERWCFAPEGEAIASLEEHPLP